MSAAAAAWLPVTTALVISCPSSCRQHREGAARALRRAQPAAFAIVFVDRAVSVAHVGQDAFGAVDDAIAAPRTGAAAEAALRFLIRGLPARPVAEAPAHLEEARSARAGRPEPALGHGHARDIAEREGGGIDQRRRARGRLRAAQSGVEAPCRPPPAADGRRHRAFGPDQVARGAGRCVFTSGQQLLLVEHRACRQETAVRRLAEREQDGVAAERRQAVVTIDRNGTRSTRIVGLAEGHAPADQRSPITGSLQSQRRRQLLDADALGERIEQLAAPLRLEGAGDGTALVCRRMTLGEPDDSGRPRPVPVDGDDGLAAFRCDTVLLALGQAPDGRLLPAGSVLDEEELLPGGEDAPACTAGDLVRPEVTVAAAIGGWRRAAWRLHAALGGVEAPSSPAPLVDASALTFRDVPRVAMAKGRLRPPRSRTSRKLVLRERGGRS